nr:pentatricopeptide repeat-containing protein At3g62890-like [Ipomoea batatas]
MISAGFIKDTYAASRILKFCTDSPFTGINCTENIFTQIENPNVFSVNTMMRAYLQQNMPQNSIFLYKIDVEGNSMRTIIHVYVRNTLINMYTVCGNMGDARKVFDESPVRDLVSWNSILAGYVQAGNAEGSMMIYDQMPRRNVIASNSMIVFIGPRDSSSRTITDTEKQPVINETARKPTRSRRVQRPAERSHVMRLRSQCSRVAEACRLFHEMDEKDLVSWTALISCYEQNGFYEEALDLFVQMSVKGIAMDEVVMWKRPRRVLFDSMVEKDRVSWTTMISGYAQHDQFSETLALFQEMLHIGVKPDETTLVFRLAMNGQLQRSLETFEEMKKHGVTLNEVTFVAVLGLLKEVEKLVQTMPMAPDVPTWGALLGACKKHGDSEMGERVRKELLELQPYHGGFHVLLSNIYASKGNSDNVEGVRGAMTQQGVVKTPGCSMIQANGIVHEFFARRDKSHPKTKEIEVMLDEMVNRLKTMGYSPGTEEVLLDIQEEEKESSLKLA